MQYNLFLLLLVGVMTYHFLGVQGRSYHRALVIAIDVDYFFGTWHREWQIIKTIVGFGSSVDEFCNRAVNKTILLPKNECFEKTGRQRNRIETGITDKLCITWWRLFARQASSLCCILFVGLFAFPLWLLLLSSVYSAWCVKMSFSLKCSSSHCIVSSEVHASDGKEMKNWGRQSLNERAADGSHQAAIHQQWTSTQWELFGWLHRTPAASFFFFLLAGV